MQSQKSLEVFSKPHIRQTLYCQTSYLQTFKSGIYGLYIQGYYEHSLNSLDFSECQWSLLQYRPVRAPRFWRGITKIIKNHPSIVHIKPSNLFFWFLNNIQTFLYFLLDFCRKCGHFCTFCTGFLSIKGLTNNKVWGIIRYPESKV